MIVKPSKPTGSLDQRLQTLTDPELSERLRATHPELFGSESLHPAPSPVQIAHTSGARKLEFWRSFAIVGSLFALVGSSALGWALRPHVSNDVTPFVSLSSMVPPRVTKHLIWRHSNLSPAAAQRIVQAQQLWLRRHPVVAAIHNTNLPIVAPRLHTMVSPKLQVQPKGHTAARTQFYQQTKTRQATATAASSSTNTTSANATEATTSAVPNDPTDSDITGRQIPRGPVWTENVPGAVVFGHGGSSGPVMPSCTPRRFSSSDQYDP